MMLTINDLFAKALLVDKPWLVQEINFNLFGLNSPPFAA